MRKKYSEAEIRKNQWNPERYMSMRLRPYSRWYNLRENFVQWVARNLDVPVVTHPASGSVAYDIAHTEYGDCYLAFFKRYNHERDSIALD